MRSRRYPHLPLGRQRTPRRRNRAAAPSPPPSSRRPPPSRSRPRASPRRGRVHDDLVILLHRARDFGLAGQSKETQPRPGSLPRSPQGNPGPPKGTQARSWKRHLNSLNCAPPSQVFGRVFPASDHRCRRRGPTAPPARAGLKRLRTPIKREAAREGERGKAGEPSQEATRHSRPQEAASCPESRAGLRAEKSPKSAFSGGRLASPRTLR